MCLLHLIFYSQHKLVLSQSLQAQGFFDLKMIALVHVVEETNATELVFARLNEQKIKRYYNNPSCFLLF